MTKERRGEAELIAHYFAPLASEHAAFGLSDDAAFLTPPPNHDLVITKDMLAADIHFFANDPAQAIAQKALRVNLSDLAAKGAKPYGYLLGLGLPLDWTEDWLAEFTAGLEQDQARYGFALFGGDTVKSPDRLMLSITAFGLVPAASRIIRPGAQVGDSLYMTGTLGDAALGLLARQSQLPDEVEGPHVAFLKDRYLLPQPRTQMAACLQEHVRAAMDISDGLLGDAVKMAKACGASIQIQVDNVPLSDAALSCLKQEPDLIKPILSGGDDYELLMAVAPSREKAFMEMAAQTNIPVTRIGQIKPGSGLKVLSQKWRLTEADSLSFEHF